MVGFRARCTASVLLAAVVGGGGAYAGAGQPMRGEAGERVARQPGASPQERAIEADDWAKEMALPGRVVARGLYRSKFGEFDAGTERFVVTRDERGHEHLAALVTSSGGMQQPYRVVVHAGGKRLFEGGWYETLAENSVRATYELVDGTLIAQAGDRRQEIPVGDDAIIVGPAQVCEHVTFRVAGLGVGESTARTAFSFGQQSWRVTAARNTITRLEDEQTNDHPVVGRATVRVYRQTLEIEGLGEMTITSRVLEDGLVLGMVLEMPFGTVRSDLVDLERAK